ncbi:MAG: sensor histidine kinase [Sulfuricellaceae bacterium]
MGGTAHHQPHVHHHRRLPRFLSPDRRKTRFSAAVLQEILALVESAFSNNRIEVVTHVEQDGKIFGFSNQYSQALLNILSNAKDLLKERQVANGRVTVHLTATTEEVRLAVEDNAGGIAPEVMDKIFDPYFTTREKGTGIGLYMTKMIVEKNLDGKILVQNTDQGAKFTLITPRAPDEDTQRS